MCWFLVLPRCAACGILVLWSGMVPLPCALEVQNLNCWTAREVHSPPPNISFEEYSIVSFDRFFFKSFFIELCNGKDSACQGKRHKRSGFNPCVRKIPWSRKRQPPSVFLPGKFHGQRCLAGYNPCGRRVRHHWAPMHNTCMEKLTYLKDTPWIVTN